jgi:tryptophan 7-halogenase
VNNPIKHIVIAGGGTAGWMAAAALSNAVGPQVAITLIESEEIMPVGVGEATIPPFCAFLRMLGVDEDEFVRATGATFKLGIEFVNWGAVGERYIHPFGKYGYDIDGIGFHHYWLKMREQGDQRSLEDYAFQAAAARAGKFMRPVDIERSPLASIAYAYHFDAGLVARFFRSYAEQRGVKRIEATIIDVAQDAETGFIRSVSLNNGQEVAGDFFIDCSGFRGLLIEGTLKAGYDDWTDLLPCDRAVAVPCEGSDAPIPYTRATAHSAGWQWRIPLQHRIGNGHVYCSAHISDDEATAQLLGNLDGKPLADPRYLRFTTGRRKKSWVKNCLALGLAAGFMEPLESTSIHLIHSGLLRLLAYFPGADFDQTVIDQYNQETEREYLYIRDFLVLHYNATQRDDSAFWRACRALKEPSGLAHKRQIFQACGQISFQQEELFTTANWLAVFVGQGVVPTRYHPLADMIAPDIVEKRLNGILQTIAASVDYMPNHGDFVDEITRTSP